MSGAARTVTVIRGPPLRAPREETDRAEGQRSAHEPEDLDKLRPMRSADRAASGPADGPGPASAGAEPAAVDEVPADEKSKYR